MEWLHFQNDTDPRPGIRNIITVNPKGHIGVLTCWNYANQAHRALKAAGADLCPQTSPIVALSPFYGRGMPQFVRNLLYNPQISRILVLGADLSGAGAFLVSLLRRKAELIAREKSSYWHHLPTGQVLLADFPLHLLQERVRILFPASPNRQGIAVASLSDQEVLKQALDFLAEPPPQNASRKRIRVELAPVALKRRPGVSSDFEIQAHYVEDAYAQLIRRAARSGKETRDERGVQRLELHRVRIRISVPWDMSPLTLAEWNQPAAVRQPPALLMKDKPAEGVAYFYGHRLRAHFGRDQIAEAIHAFQNGTRTLTLRIWDPDTDPQRQGAKPCLVAIHLALENGRFYVSADFRKHNLADAWLTNVHDLILLQKYLKKELGFQAGGLVLWAERLSLRTADTDAVERLIRRANEHDFFKLSLVSKPPPALCWTENNEGLWHATLWNGRSAIQSGGWLPSQAAVKARLYQLLTDPAIRPNDHPCASLADAIECGRLLGP